MYDVNPWMVWRRRVAQAGTLFLLLAIGAAPAWSAKPNKPTSAKRASANLPSGSPELLNWASTLENQVADLIQKRPDVSGPRASILELQIDLRLLQRSILQQAAQIKGDDATAAIDFLRAVQLQHACGYADGWAEKPPATLSADQLGALKAIHELTFKADDLASTAKLDEACGLVGAQLLLATNVRVPGNRLPMMRPSSTNPALSGPTATTTAPPTVASLSASVRAMSVSVPLRRALLALADAAKTEKDSRGPLASMLAAAVDLARGLQSNTAVDPDTRTQIEQKLADGLALYTDPRTRSAGKSRIDSLDQYRQLLTRVGRLNLTREQATQFGPAFTWARQNPEDGGKVLAAIEQYSQISTAHAARALDASQPSTARKIQNDLEQQFANTQAQFVSAVGEIGQGGAISAGPAELELSIDAMKQADSACDLMTRVPQDTKALLAFRPRPVGGLEKQINLATAKLSSLQTPQGTAALKFMQDVDRLAQVTSKLADASVNNVPPAVGAAYGGPAAAQFEAKWRSTAASLVSALAGGGTVDDAVIDQLSNAVKLRDALKGAANVDAAVSKAAELQAWADWAVPQQELKDLLASYQQAMSDAFSGFANGDPGPVNQFLDQHRKFRPLLALFAQVAGYADQLAALPSDLVAVAAQLATPMDHQPFELERITAYGLWRWNFDQQSGDSDGADAIFAALSQRVQRDLGK